MSTSDPVASHAASPTVVPALYVSHGAPLFAVDAGETGPALTPWGQGPVSYKHLSLPMIITV